MKKAVLATAVLSALVIAPTQAATVYDNDGTVLKVGGRAEARFNVSDNNEKDGNSTFKDKSRARVNLKGKTQVNENLYGFGKYEAEFSGDDSLKNRYFFAGLGFGGNEVSYGKQDSAQVMITDFTDTLATFGAEAADIVAGNKDKRSNNFLYAGEFGGFTLKANYIAANEKDMDSAGIAGIYAIESIGLDLGLGYVSQENGSDDDSQFNVGAQWGYDSFTLGGLIVGGEVAKDDILGYELSAKLKATKELTVLAVYNFLENDSQSTDLVDEFSVEAVYKFNKHIRTYAGYKFQQIDGSDDELQAGIRYDF